MIECKYCKSPAKPIDGFRFHDVYECVECNRLTYSKIKDCCKDSFDIVVFKYENGIARKIFKQCYNCGGCIHMTKPLPFKEYSHLVRGEFSTDRLEQWKYEKGKEARELSHIAEVVWESKYSVHQYRTYLQSKHWRDLREIVLERDRQLCQFCKKEKATLVHHFSYKNLGNESLDELISCCKVCHETIHGMTVHPHGQY